MIFNENGEIVKDIFDTDKSINRQISEILLSKSPPNFDNIVLFADVSKNQVAIECFYKYKNKKIPLYEIDIIAKISTLLKELQNIHSKFNRDNSKWQYCMISIDKNGVFMSHFDYNDNNISFDQFKNSNSP